MKELIKHDRDCNFYLDDESDSCLYDYQDCTCNRDKFIKEICSKFGVQQEKREGVSVEDIDNEIQKWLTKPRRIEETVEQLYGKGGKELATAIYNLLNPSSKQEGKEA